jgi:hypothetical protein
MKKVRVTVITGMWKVCAWVEGKERRYPSREPKRGWSKQSTWSTVVNLA